MKIKAVIWQEDGIWCGSVPALPGCHTWGESYKQLVDMLEDAIQGWLDIVQPEIAIGLTRSLLPGTLIERKH
jgi:predicted RNase H-like HicB family nuclease